MREQEKKIVIVAEEIAPVNEKMLIIIGMITGIKLILLIVLAELYTYSLSKGGDVKFNITKNELEMVLALTCLICFIYIMFVGLSVSKRIIESILIRIIMGKSLKPLDKDEIKEFCKRLNMVKKSKIVNGILVVSEIILLLIVMATNKSIKIIIPILILSFIDFLLRLIKTRQALLNYLELKEVAQPVFSKEQNI